MSPVAASAKTVLYGEQGHALDWLMGTYLHEAGSSGSRCVPSWQVPVRGPRLCGWQWVPMSAAAVMLLA